jgi:hypothetical protein
MKRNLEISLTIFLSCGVLAMAQQPPIDPFEAVGGAAASGPPQEVRALTDTVVGYLPLAFHNSIGVNERLFQAELLYRQHQRRGVALGQIVTALNQFAGNQSLPSYAKTNFSQVQTYWLPLARVHPTLLGPAPHAPGQQSGPEISPAAALYIALHLLNMKLTEPSYQVDPDAWVRAETVRAAQRPPGPPSQSAVFTIGSPPPALSPQYQPIASSLANGVGPAVASVQALLGAFGI